MLHKYSTLARVILRFAFGFSTGAHNNDIWQGGKVLGKSVWERMKGCNCCATKEMAQRLFL